MIGSNQDQVMASDAQKPVEDAPLFAVEFGDGWISATAWHHLKKVNKQVALSDALKGVEFGDGWISSSVWHHLRQEGATLAL
jgi:hypothetical protein